MLRPCPRATHSTARPVASRCSSGSGSRSRRRTRAAPGEAAGRTAGRAAARVGRGGRKEPAASLRGRPRPAQPPADERALVRPPRAAPRARAGRGSSFAASATRRLHWQRARCCELDDGVARRLGPDILADAARRRRDARQPASRRPPTLASARRSSASGSSPGSGTCGWPKRSGRRGSRRGRPVGDASADAELRAALEAAHRLMRALARRRSRGPRRVYRRAGRPCPRCGTPIRSRGQGDANRMAYWCPRCQQEERRPGSKGSRGRPRAAPLRVAPRVLPRARSSCFGRELEEGAELPFAFEEHASRGRPALYEYRPLVARLRRGARRRGSPARGRAARARRLGASSRPPRIFARAHAGRESRRGRRPAPRACSCRCSCGRRRRAAASTGTTTRSRPPTPRSSARSSATVTPTRAVAPLVGLSVASRSSSAAGSACARRRPASWPRTGRRRAGCCPRTSAARSTGCACSSSSARFRAARRSRPTRRASSRTPSPRSASRPPARSRGPGGLRAARLAPVRDPRRGADRGDAAAGRADAARRLPRPARRATCCERLALADDDPELGEALDRWELSLFQAEPFRSEQLREALVALLGGTDGLWAAAVRGGDAARRAGVRARRAARAAAQLAGGERAGPAAADAIRRALVETLVHGDRLASCGGSTTRCSARGPARPDTSPASPRSGRGRARLAA